MRVDVDRARCVGHGRCYVLAPELFTDDESGYAVVVGSGVVGEAATAAAAQAHAGCPEGAVLLVED